MFCPRKTANPVSFGIPRFKSGRWRFFSKDGESVLCGGDFSGREFIA